MENQKNNKRSVLTYIGLLVFIIIIIIVVRLVCFGIFFSIFSEENSKDFEVQEDKIIIQDEHITIDNLDSYYDEKAECFVVSVKVDKETAEEKKKMFSVTNTELEVYYAFKDSEDYIIGEEMLYISDIDQNNKWKQSISYCGVDAKNVKSFEVNSINMY